MPARTELESGGSGQLRIRFHADAHDHEVRRQFGTVLQARIQRIALFPESGQFGVQSHIDAVCRKLRAEQPGHLAVDRRKHMPGVLNDRHLKAAPAQVFGRFEPDETAADHQRLPGAVRRKSAEGIHIRNRPERMNAEIVPAGQLRRGRPGTGRQQEFVVGLLIFGAVRPADRNRFPDAVDGDRLVPGPDLDVEPRPELFLGHDQQRIAFRDDAAQMIRQPAVRVGDVAAALQQNDFHGFVQPPQPRRSACPRGDSADNQCFHEGPPGFETNYNIIISQYHNISNRSFRFPDKIP